MHDPLKTIAQMFDASGTLRYGEHVNQIEHALQCATLAQAAGSADELVVAALLHDVGHLLHRDARAALLAGVDDVHENLGAKYLARWFGQAVCQPIALHVQAKRYLCWLEPSYHALLSPVSQRTLTLQGGSMSKVQALEFEAYEHAAAAVLLRRWDDEAKVAGLATPHLAHFMAVAERCLLVA
jgi:phosphonate degradation associated HDIG domain protein